MYLIFTELCVNTRKIGSHKRRDGQGNLNCFHHSKWIQSSVLLCYKMKPQEYALYGALRAHSARVQTVQALTKTHTYVGLSISHCLHAVQYVIRSRFFVLLFPCCFFAWLSWQGVRTEATKHQSYATGMTEE